MKLAIMQPYIFPYVGYYQLINASGKFIIFDDVNYINKGWINRNNILLNNQPNMFTIPLKDASQNRLINEIEVAGDVKWRHKLLKTIEMAYKKAPLFNEVMPVIETVLNMPGNLIADIASASLSEVTRYLDMPALYDTSSVKYANRHLKGQERILDICQQESATEYINPIGGTELYNKQDFDDKGIALKFIKCLPFSYAQFNNIFVSNLSMIDLLMFNSRQQAKALLDMYELI